jgi:hypothetical protein
MVSWFFSLIYLLIALGKALDVFTEVFYNVLVPNITRTSIGHYLEVIRSLGNFFPSSGCHNVAPNGKRGSHYPIPVLMELIFR